MRTAGSAGRSRSLAGREGIPKRRPGTRSSVPDWVAPPACRGAGYEAQAPRPPRGAGRSAPASPGSSAPRARPRSARRSTTRTRARRGSRVPGRRTSRLPRRSRPARAARRSSARAAPPALPRPVGGPSTVPWGKIATAAPARERGAAAATAADVSAAALDRDPAERVEDAVRRAGSARARASRGSGAAGRARRRGRRGRRASRGSRRRSPGRQGSAPPPSTSEPPDGAERRRQDRADDAVEASRRPGTSRTTRAVSSARRAYPSGVPWTRSPASSDGSLGDHRRPLDETDVRVRGAAPRGARRRSRFVAIPSRTIVAHTRHRSRPDDLDGLVDELAERRLGPVGIVRPEADDDDGSEPRLRAPAARRSPPSSPARRGRARRSASRAARRRGTARRRR